LPTQGNRATRAFGRLILRLAGWRVEGSIPNKEKLLVIAAPHTTSWDFVIGMIAILALGIRVSWLGVDWVVRYPFMRSFGGIPVDRSAPREIVPRAIERFRTHTRHILALSPEGSRRKVVPWKTGFYRIAAGAGVPLVLAAIDPQRKLITIGPEVVPSGDYEADMEEKIRPFYAGYVERYPDQFGL
jgi:1-acyl-sn-glycerol-3-phosphate acyltransferase